MSPSNETVEYGATYEVTCNTGFTITGSSTMVCGADGNVDQTPKCRGKTFMVREREQINCSKSLTYKVQIEHQVQRKLCGEATKLIGTKGHVKSKSLI